MPSDSIAPIDLVYCAPGEDPGPWERGLAAAAAAAELPPVRLHCWPDVSPDVAASARFAFLWSPPAALFDALPKLEVAFSLGAGVDHLLRLPHLPAALPVVRMVDPGLTSGMTEYVLFNVLRFQRRFDEYERLRARGEWRELAQVPASATRVGILGAGVLGADAARRLVSNGYDVACWSRSGSTLDGVESFAGPAALDAFLARTHILVNLLPLSDATRHLLDAPLFAKLPRGAFVVNCGRGGHLVETDLLAALDNHQIAGAALDVFAEEPLPADSTLWRHDRVWITPHVASLTSAHTGAMHVVDGLRRHLAGEPLIHVVDRQHGY